MLDLPPVTLPLLTPVTAECVRHAGEFYGVHPDILYAIQIVEGGTVGKDGDRPNSDGTKDIGAAQINSIHLEELAALNISEEELRNNGCLNVYVQARYVSIVLSQVKRMNSEEDYFYAIARYH